MSKKTLTRERLSIDVLSEEHRRIKMYAAFHGETLREYIIKSVQERLRQETEQKELLGLVTNLSQDSILSQIWDNPKDAAYDKI